MNYSARKKKKRMGIRTWTDRGGASVQKLLCEINTIWDHAIYLTVQEEAYEGQELTPRAEITSQVPSAIFILSDSGDCTTPLPVVPLNNSTVIFTWRSSCTVIIRMAPVILLQLVDEWRWWWSDTHERKHRQPATWIKWMVLHNLLERRGSFNALPQIVKEGSRKIFLVNVAAAAAFGRQ